MPYAPLANTNTRRPTARAAADAKWRQNNMADTIVNTPSGNDSGAGGWAVAVIILLIVIVGGFVWYRYYRAPAAAPATNNSINVTVPAAPAATPSP